MSKNNKKEKYKILIIINKMMIQKYILKKKNY